MFQQLCCLFGVSKALKKIMLGNLVIGNKTKPNNRFWYIICAAIKCRQLCLCLKSDH